MKIYIACALTNVPKEVFTEYGDFITDIGLRLKSEDCAVKFALANTDFSIASSIDKPMACYFGYRKIIEETELIIADVSFPSTGLGIELQIAEAKNIPVVLSCKKNIHETLETKCYTNDKGRKYNIQVGSDNMSLMVLGMPNIINVISYINYKNGISSIVEFIKSYQNHSKLNNTIKLHEKKA